MDSASRSNKSEVALLATSLDKLIDSPELSDEVLVIINALEKITITVELLRETKVGVIVNKCKKKFPDNNELSEKCKNLINEWKKIAEAPRSNPAAKAPTLAPNAASVKEGKTSLTLPEDTTSDLGTETQTGVAGTSSNSALATTAVSTPFEEVDTGFNDYYDNLPKSRKQVTFQTPCHYKLSPNK